MLHYDFVLMLLLDEGVCMPVHDGGEGRGGKLLNLLLVDLYFEFIYLFNLEHVTSSRTGHFGEDYAVRNFCALGGLVGLQNVTIRCQQWQIYIYR